MYFTVPSNPWHVLTNGLFLNVLYNFEILENFLGILLLISDLALCGHEVYSKISDMNFTETL